MVSRLGTFCDAEFGNRCNSVVKIFWKFETEFCITQLYFCWIHLTAFKEKLKNISEIKIKHIKSKTQDVSRPKPAQIIIVVVLSRLSSLAVLKKRLAPCGTRCVRSNNQRCTLENKTTGRSLQLHTSTRTNARFESRLQILEASSQVLRTNLSRFIENRKFNFGKTSNYG